jgi:hypothetical protein
VTPIPPPHKREKIKNKIKTPKQQQTTTIKPNKKALKKTQLSTTQKT